MDIDTLAAYDRDARAFADDWQAQPDAADLHELLTTYFTQGPTADIGSGSGRETAWLASHGYPATGFEPSTGLLAEARRRYPDVTFLEAALPDLPGAGEGAFTNVLCETVIMHLPPDIVEASLARMVGLLAPGGTLFLSWRVTDGGDQRDGHGRLYAVVDEETVCRGLDGTETLLSEEKVNASSGRVVRRVIARRP